VIPIERTHEYQGVYPRARWRAVAIEGHRPEDLKIAELLARIGSPTTQAWGRRQRVRRASPCASRAGDQPYDDGQATALHIAEHCARAPRSSRYAPGQWTSVGSDLEYADEVTLARPFAGRRSV